MSHDNNNFYSIFEKMDINKSYEIDVKELIISKKYVDRLNPDINKNSQDLPNWLKENDIDDKMGNQQVITSTTEVKERIHSPNTV